jgi:transcriptional regulator with XRE-family HTH domain
MIIVGFSPCARKGVISMANTEEVLSRILTLMEDENISQKDFCIAIGLKSAQAFTNWKNGNNTSFMKKLPEISTFLKTSVDYLIGNTDEKHVPDYKLNELDFALSGEIRELSDNEKLDLLDYIQFKKHKKEEK